MLRAEFGCRGGGKWHREGDSSLPKTGLQEGSGYSLAATDSCGPSGLSAPRVDFQPVLTRTIEGTLRRVAAGSSELASRNCGAASAAGCCGSGTRAA